MATSPDITRSISEFSTDLYAAVAEGQTSNVLISPFSVHMAVSLALMGAKGKTSEEMLRGLKLNGTNAEISEEIHRLIDPIQNNSLLSVANKVYVMETFRIKPEFNAIAKEKFDSESESINFAEAVQSASAINKWVEDKTNNKVKDLISSETLGANTRMVLVNAIYFKGFWNRAFLKQYTHKALFYTSETQSIFVDMMNVKEYFPYGQFDDLDARAVELPYKDSDMSMLVILPNKRTGLAELETRLKLKSINMGDLSRQMHISELKVDVTLPKFKIEFEVSLVDALNKLGMSDMFSKTADFSGLLETTESLPVTDVIHKAFIDVNEEGAEAAAATGLVFGDRSAVIDNSIPFNVDRGFVYAITSRSLGTIFIGRKLS